MAEAAKLLLLVHEVPHDVTNIMGLYSTMEKAVEARKRYLAFEGHIVKPDEEDLNIYTLEIDEDGWGPEETCSTTTATSDEKTS